MQKPAKHIILSNLDWDIIQYHICEGSNNAKVLQLAEKHEVPKFPNSLVYNEIYEKIVKFFCFVYECAKY